MWLPDDSRRDGVAAVTKGEPHGVQIWRPRPAAHHHGRGGCRNRCWHLRRGPGLDRRLGRGQLDNRTHHVHVLVSELVGVLAGSLLDARTGIGTNPSLHPHGRRPRQLGPAKHLDELTSGPGRPGPGRPAPRTVRARTASATGSQGPLARRRAPDRCASVRQRRAAPPRGCAALPLPGYGLPGDRQAGQVSMRAGSSSVAPLTMKSRRGATSLPISRSNMPCAASASSILIRRNVRRRGSIVVSAS